MIDTIRCKISGDWKGRVSGWSEQAMQGMSAGEKGERDRDYRSMIHEETGLRLMGDMLGPSIMELSLPRQLYPHNGYLLADQAALGAAWDKALERSARVADFEPGKLTRVDLVWQYNGDPAAWVQALGSARHPKVRKEPCQWFGQSVMWQGKETVLRVYDKSLEILGEPGDVVRLESQLRGKVLNKAVGEICFRELDFARCWSAYRETWAKLPAFSVWSPGSKRSFAGFLALLQSEGLKIHGVPAEDVYILGLGQRQQRRVRTQISRAAVAEIQEIDLAEMLPVGHPPEVVHLVA